MLNKIIEGHKAGWQVWVHANGDRAQDMVLTAYEAAQQADAPGPTLDIASSISRTS